MGYFEAIKTCYSKYCVIQGRAKRSEYWWFILFYVIVYAVLGGAMAAVGPNNTLFTMLNVVLIVFLLTIILPLFAVAIRRLHDLDKSGWWLLIQLIPLIGALVLLYWFVQAGTPGPNRFGN